MSFLNATPDDGQVITAKCGIQDEPPPGNVSDGQQSCGINFCSSCDSSDDEDAMLICRTEEDFDSIDSMEMTMEADGPGISNCSNVLTSLKFASAGDVTSSKFASADDEVSKFLAREDYEQENCDTTECKNVDNVEHHDDTGSIEDVTKQMCARTDEKSNDVETVQKEEQIQLIIENKEKESLDSSENLSVSDNSGRENGSVKRKSLRIKQSRKNGCKMGQKSPKSNDKASAKVKCTPLMGTEKQMYETPLMDEGSLKQNLVKISKAPKKRRSDTVINLQKSNESHKKNARLSLAEITDSVINAKPVGAEGRKRQGRKSKGSPSNTKDCKKQVEREIRVNKNSLKKLEDGEVLPVNQKGRKKDEQGVDATGDAKINGRKSSRKWDEILMPMTINEVNKEKKTSFHQSGIAKENSSASKNEISPMVNCFDFDDDFPLSDRIVSSDCESVSSMAADWNAKKRETNKSLMKTLTMMKRTVETPSSPLEQLSDRSAALLSPTLSGISTVRIISKYLHSQCFLLR